MVLQISHRRMSQILGRRLLRSHHSTVITKGNFILIFSRFNCPQAAQLCVMSIYD